MNENDTQIDTQEDAPHDVNIPTPMPTADALSATEATLNEVNAVAMEEDTSATLAAEATLAATSAVAAPALVASKRKTGIIAAIIFATLLAIALGAFWYMKQQHENAVVGMTDYPAVVAIVNGEEVSATQFKQSYDQAAAVAVQQGFDPATSADAKKEVEAQAIKVLINTVLMVQEAKAAGFTATEEAISAEVAKLEAQFGSKEQLASALTAAGIDEAAMRHDLGEQIMVDQYIESTPEWGAIAVTDAEVRAFYDQAIEGMENAPAYDTVIDQVRAEVQTQKQQAATNALIERIRKDAKIDVKI